MDLQKLKNHFEKFPKGTEFNFGISEPFSWRGSYDEVAFAIEGAKSREDILKNIELAYTEKFFGYKGGEYKYNDWTSVNFEEKGAGNYSNGGYVSRKIAELEEDIPYESQEDRLVGLAFSQACS